MHPSALARDDAYARHLLGVSRSFAPCIAELEPPLRQWVALSYLLCRLLDTVEDAPWQSLRAQHQQFLGFDRFARRSPDLATLAGWQAAFPRAIPAAEAALVADAHSLFADLDALPQRVGRTLRRGLVAMAKGMQRFAQQRTNASGLRLRGTADVNHYCYVVAGVVGVLLVELFACSRNDFRPSPALRRDAAHFGLLLQKVNLLKDQAQDEREGRHLVPARADLLATLPRHATAAGRFLLALPMDAQPFRRFCAYSLFLAASSLPAVLAGAGGKLARNDTLTLFGHVRALCRHNGALRSSLRDAIATLPHSEPVPALPAASAQRFLRTLPGQRHVAAVAAALI